MVYEEITAEKYSLIPLEFVDQSTLDKNYCGITESRDNIDNNLVMSLNISCRNCPKSTCALGEYMCARNIVHQLIDEKNYSSMVIDGKNANYIFDNHQIERVYGLSRIYKKAPLNPIKQNEGRICSSCHVYLTRLFQTLRTLIVADPGMLYKNRQFYRKYANGLCDGCRRSLLGFINHVEDGLEYLDPEWCQKIDVTRSFKVDFYTPLVNHKSSSHTVLVDPGNSETISERDVGGYNIQIANEKFKFGNTTNNNIDRMFPLTNTEFYRRQKLYIVDIGIPDNMVTVVEKLKEYIITDSETKRILRYTFKSNDLRKIIVTKINQILPLYLEELGFTDSLTESERKLIENRVIEYTVGWGVWEIFMHDDQVNEFSAVAGSPIYVETYSDGKCKTNVVPSTEEYERFLRMLHINIPVDFFNRVLETVIDPAKHPIHFGRMRLTLFAKPLVDNHTFIVRKHRKMQLSGGEILHYKTMSSEMLAFCTTMKRRNKSNITYVGDVGSGKTTIQFIIDTKIPIDSTVITIGDIIELDLCDMGFNNITLYADRPGEESIGQTRDSLISKALRMKSDMDLITEVLSPEDTASWIQTWVAGKSGSVTYHAYSIDMMLIRCADELRASGTVDPATKMSIFQTIVSSRRILSTEGYKYRVVDIHWVTDDINEKNSLPKTLPIFTWDGESDTHHFNVEAFNTVLNSDKFKNMLFSVDTVKHVDLINELALYEILWKSLENAIQIYSDIGIMYQIAMGNIPQFTREVELFTNMYDAQVDMFRKNNSTDWEELQMIGKRKIYSGVVDTVQELAPEKISDVYALINRFEKTDQFVPTFNAGILG